MRFVLYNHVGSANHGCEALVRTISNMLGEEKCLLLSDCFYEEEKYGINNLIEVNSSVEEMRKISWDFIYSYLILKLKKNYFYMDIVPYKKAIRNLKRTDVLVSIGGDIFCYDNYPKYILLHQYALKKIKHSILLGCSIEPELLKDEMLTKDLKSFELISARESITYDALKNAGYQNVDYCPDSAFSLEAKKTFLPPNFVSGKTVGINISPLVLEKAENEELILENIRQVVRDVLENTDFSVAFIPHVVWKKNDDRIPLGKLFNEFSDSNRVCIVEDQDARKIKWVISQCTYFIGSRTHATIAAYSSGVPTLVIGYSVKSRGIARDLFGTEENFVIPYQNIVSNNQVLKNFHWIMRHSFQISEVLKKKTKIYQDKINDFGKCLIERYVTNEM